MMHEDLGQPDVLWSKISQVTLGPESSVDEANTVRMTDYFGKDEGSRSSRPAIPGCDDLPLEELQQLRTDSLAQTMRFHKVQSHRTVVVPLTGNISGMLEECRQDILATLCAEAGQPLSELHNAATARVWTAEPNLIPKEHMHITMAIPMFWHEVEPIEVANAKNRRMVEMWRRVLAVQKHQSFEVEIDRVVFLGGSVLLALWRTVGVRENVEGYRVVDRSSPALDPVNSLRGDLVRTFLDAGLTYRALMDANKDTEEQKADVGMLRTNTIAQRSPQGGFIHTSLARLARAPSTEQQAPFWLNRDNLDLTKVYSKCSEWSIKLSGHRMIVDKFWFLETDGAGGDADPVEQPRFMETINMQHAPQHALPTQARLPEEQGHTPMRVMEAQLDADLMAVNTSMIGTR